ncbi:NAD(P)/FAD-dependent oxidoreductase [Shewanella gelidii]|uniref:Amine oxidase n=1 Tax=Shewanella gelidii TaxID=1642821 RepID=A0A917JHW4_9GAMM|nr:FAD-dependent oxidoreductase [Shewanella gelidii]MCL1096738.1 FAD-dependent oxidoreductase [Shewanella gelidii]GGI69843.1 amine oxidase [Shewanella gelidii]
MKNIAVIGSGVSGLTCAHVLSEKHKVTVFEANDYIGGHTATVDVDVAGKTYAIDTGFIVFNDRTYPNFQKLLAKLNVQSIPTEMSFSVHHALTGLEYNGHTLASMFAQRSNLFKVSFWSFLAEIVRFNKTCKALYQENRYPDTNLGQFLIEEEFSDFFCQHYILPMGAAIWSSSIDDMRAFSIQFFVRFFEHHGLLNITDRPQWYVLKGGSRSYIPDLIRPFANNIRLSTPVEGVRRTPEGVLLQIDKEWHAFDEVIFACHSDQALGMLKDATENEKKILRDLQYKANEVVLHTDKSLLPKREAAWASWNYRLDGDVKRPASVTYNMNILQQLPQGAPTFCVTLNQSELIDESKILRKFVYDHPVFNEASLAAQKQWHVISGIQHTHFAGAYWFNGFHEDGVKSGLAVCKHFGLSL